MIQNLKKQLIQEQRELLATIRSTLKHKYSAEFLQELKEQGTSKAIINALVRFECGDLWKLATLPRSQDDEALLNDAAKKESAKVSKARYKIANILNTHPQDFLEYVRKIKDYGVREKVLCALCGITKLNRIDRFVFISICGT